MRLQILLVIFLGLTGHVAAHDNVDSLKLTRLETRLQTLETTVRTLEADNRKLKLEIAELKNTNGIPAITCAEREKYLSDTLAQLKKTGFSETHPDHKSTVRQLAAVKAECRDTAPAAASKSSEQVADCHLTLSSLQTKKDDFKMLGFTDSHPDIIEVNKVIKEISISCP